MGLAAEEGDSYRWFIKESQDMALLEGKLNLGEEGGRFVRFTNLGPCYRWKDCQ